MSRRNEKLYHVYYGIKQRCYNSKNSKYYLYGGKGIRLCNEWNNDYEKFKIWSLKNGYKEEAGLSIDRIDSNKDYCPENCQWISLSKNSAKANKNRSKKGTMFAVSPNNELIEFTNISEFCRKYHLDRCLVSHRLNGIIKDPHLNGWRIYNQK